MARASFSGLSTMLTAFFVCMSASMFFVFPRCLFDEMDRKVMLVVDGSELSRAARAVGADRTRLARRLSDCGVNAVAVSRLDLNELASDGVVEILPGPDGTPFAHDGGDDLYVRLCRNDGRDFRIYETLRKFVAVERRGDVLRIFASGSVLRKARLFWDRTFVSTMSACGLGEVHRFQNHLWNGLELHEALLDGVAPGSLVLFDEKHVLGWPDRLGRVAELFRSRGLIVGLVEFAGQFGVKELVRKWRLPSLIVHSITEKEMVKFSIGRFIPRWVRAVRERRVRVLYLRLFPPENPPPGKGSLLDRNLDYFAKVSKALRRRGFIPGTPMDPFRHVLGPSNSVLYFLALFLLMVGLALLCGLFVGLAGLLPFNVAVVLSALPVLSLGAMMGLGMEGQARKIAALGLAVLAPAVAILLFFRMVERNIAQVDGEEKTGGMVVRVLLALLLVPAVCVAAGFGIHGMLGTPSFLAKLDSFSGVKLVYLVPPLLVCWTLVMEYRSRPWKAPVTWFHLGLLGAAAAAAVLYVMRSGNFSLLPASALEHGLRDGLDLSLPVRPRTKEFLVGYPALLLTAMALAYRKRLAAALCLVAGTVAAVSVANSFCHLACSPVLNLWRTLIALLLSLPVAAILLPLWRFFMTPSGDAVMLVGYYGHGNCGDDLVLSAISSVLVKDGRVGPVELVAAVSSPGRAPEWKGGPVPVRFVDGRLPWRVVPELLRTRVLLYGGGSLFQDRTSFVSLVYYASFIVLSRLCLVERRMFVAQGVGPVEHSLSRALLAMVVSDCDFVQVRDGRSATLLGKLGAEPVETGTDPAFWCEWSGDLLPACRRERNTALALRPAAGWDGKRLAALASVLDEFVADGERLSLLALHPAMDRSLLQDLADRLTATGRLAVTDVSHDTLFERVACSRVCVCMRYHAMLAAIMTETPFLAISYDPKTEELLDEMDWPYRLDSNDFKVDDFREKLGMLYDNLDEAARMVSSFRGRKLEEGRLALESFLSALGGAPVAGAAVEARQT